MKIQVFGMGCPGCKKLYAQTGEVIKEMGIKAEVEYIDDLQRLLDLGVMSSPVLVIDGQPLIVGRIPDKKSIREAILSGGKDQQRECGCKCDGECE